MKLNYSFVLRNKHDYFLMKNKIEIKKNVNQVVIYEV